MINVHCWAEGPWVCRTHRRVDCPDDSCNPTLVHDPEVSTTCMRERHDDGDHRFMLDGDIAVAFTDGGDA